MGDVLVRSWNTLRHHLPTFLLLVGLAELPPLILTLYLDRPRGSAPSWPDLLEMVLSTFAEAIVVFAAFQDLRGRPVEAGESLNRGVARALPALGATFLVVVLMLGGLALCIVPGLMVLAAYSVVLPVCVVEGLGPLASLGRSAGLTKGHRWPILGIGVSWMIMSVVVEESIYAALPAAGPAELVKWGFDVLGNSYFTVYSAILYHDLRAVREGIGIDEIAAVFD
jgi:hypothetical protein